MGIRSRTGFTLVEMLVVIGIIAILVTIMVPQIGKARAKAQEAAVKVNCANIESALASYAASHDGNYPGAAIDVMAPYPDHALGDPALYAAAAPPIAGFSYGVLGGTGCFNPSTQSAQQQLKTVKDTVLTASTLNTARWFDSLVVADSLSEFPPNQFNKSGGMRMLNVFCFEGQRPASAVDMSTIRPYILSNPTRDNSTTPADVRFTTRRRIVNNWNTLFGYDPNNVGTIHNAAGDFAYVPILSLSAAPYADNPMTPEDDRYRWGTNVGGYMLFAYGDPDGRVNAYQAEKDAFGRTGLPGFGAETGGPTECVACDTPYEQAVFALFNSAIFYSHKP